MHLGAATVLLVDDEPANLALLCEALARAGHRVLVAESGESAVELVPQVVPDLVLLDVRLPGLDGFAVCSRLRQDARWSEVPVIFLTSLTEPDEKVRAFACGAVDYVTKPIQAGEVVARVGAQLGLLALRRELAARNAELETEVAARRETEALLKHSLDHAVVLVEADGTVSFATRRAEHLLHTLGAEGTVQRLPEALGARIEARAGRERLRLERAPWPELEVQVLPTGGGEGGGYCLVLTEAEPTPTPAALLSLGLTAREAEVLFWIYEGKNNPEIAIVLGISGRTVEKHVENVLNKLGADHRHAAARVAQDTFARLAGAR